MVRRTLVALTLTLTTTFRVAAQLPDEPGAPASPIAKAVPVASVAPVTTETIYLSAPPLDPFCATDEFIHPPGHKAEVPTRGPLLWFDTEYLMWFVRSASLPTIAETVPLTQAAAGTFDPRTARQAYPNGSLNPGPLSGVRATIGMWANPDQDIGFELNYFWLAPRSVNSAFSSGAGSALARPVVDAGTNEIRLLYRNFPGLFQGGIATEYETKFNGGEANVLFAGPDGVVDRLDFIAGFRYLDFQEKFRVADAAGLSVGAASGSLTSFDEFTTRNQFYGGQVGVRLREEFGCGKFVTDLGLKFALGGLQADADVKGATSVQALGVFAQSQPGGVLALPPNLGGVTRLRTVFVPELAWNVGYRPTKHTMLYAGYNFLFMTDVLRPEGVIDTTVNPQFLPFTGGLLGTGTALRPAPRSDFTDLWVQGLTFGFAVEY